MRYYLDLKKNGDGKRLIHSEYCIDGCPECERIGHKRALGEFYSKKAALNEAKYKFPRWSDSIYYCRAEQGNSFISAPPEVNYYLDLEEDEEGRNYIHSESCKKDCETYEQEGDNYNLGKFTNREKALSEAREIFPDLNISYCQREDDLQAQENDRFFMIGCLTVFFSAVAITALFLFFRGGDNAAEEKVGVQQPAEERNLDPHKSKGKLL